MDFTGTLHRDSLRDLQYVCSFSGHQVKGHVQGYIGKKNSPKTLTKPSPLIAFMDLNETLHSDSLRDLQNDIVCSFSGHLSEVKVTLEKL